MSDLVQVTRDGNVAVVTLNRPDKLNAVSTEVFRGLYDAGQQVAADDEARAVVIRGEGRAFCAGLDLGSLGGMANADPGSASGDQQDGALGFDAVQGGFSCWQEMDKPVVAAVQGYALGAGFQLALAADIRIASDDAVMSVFEVTYGLVPDLGGTQLLPLVAGPARAKELIWTARRFSAAEAHEWGIVNTVVPAEQLQKEAMVLAQDLASRPPLPIKLAKQLVAQAGSVPLREGMKAEQKAQLTCLASNDMREAVAASFEKRPGTYTGT